MSKGYGWTLIVEDDGNKMLIDQSCCWCSVLSESSRVGWIYFHESSELLLYNYNCDWFTIVGHYYLDLKLPEPKTSMNRWNLMPSAVKDQSKCHMSWRCPSFYHYALTLPSEVIMMRKSSCIHTVSEASSIRQRSILLWEDKFDWLTGVPGRHICTLYSRKERILLLFLVPSYFVGKRFARMRILLSRIELFFRRG